MSSEWTSKKAIMRDLALIQGHVPVEVDVVSGDAPPAYNNKEETEEIFYSEYNDDFDCHKGPDLDGIQRMLAEVGSYESHNEDIEFGDQLTQQDRVCSISSVGKQKVQKNGIAKVNTNDDMSFSQTEGLFRHQKTSNMITEPHDEEKKSIKHPQKVMLSSTQMFKKRTKPVTENNVVDNTKISKNLSEGSGLKHSMDFTPSTFAEEYYKEYECRAKKNEVLYEDIWTRVQQQMREIDAKRKQKASVLEYPPAPVPADLFTRKLSADEQKRISVLILPQTRHQLTGDCIVCKVIGNYS